MVDEDFKNVLKQYQSQVEGFLKENESLDPEYKIPLEEFSLNNKKLESLKQALRDREEAVVQQVEGARLKRQLECHYLKEIAWNKFRKPSCTICSTSGSFCVNNYPISSNSPSPDLFYYLWLRLKDSAQINECDIPEINIPKEEKFLWKTFFKVNPSNQILLSQFLLNSFENVHQQIALLEILKIRLKDEFNASFDAKKSRKKWILQEIRRLIQQHRELKHEIKRFSQYESKKMKTDEAVSSFQFLSNLKEESEKDENFEVPEWFPEERPETMLYVEDGEISAMEEVEEEVTSSVSSSSSSSFQEIPEEEERLPIVKSNDIRLSHLLSFQMYGDSESPWPWVKAQEERSKVEKEEIQHKFRISNASRLALQIQRTKPTIESLKKEFDLEVFALSAQRIETDQKIHICEAMKSRLLRRVHTEQDIEKELKDVKQKHYKLELKRIELVEDISKIYRKEKKAKVIVEGLLKTLKDEDAAVQRAFINLPVEVYKHILTLYRTSKSYETSPNVSCENQLAEAQKKTPAQSTNDDDKTMEIGSRTWRLYNRYRLRKDEIVEELEIAKENQNRLTKEFAKRNEEKSHLTTCIADAEALITRLTEGIQNLNEDLELFFLLPSKQIKIGLEGMTNDLLPDFSDTQLILLSEFDELQKKAGKRVEGGDQRNQAPKTRKEKKKQKFVRNETNFEEDERSFVTTEAKTTMTRSEVEELVKERDRLLLQVELAEERLKQITHMKVGREMMREKPSLNQSIGEESPRDKYDPNQQLYDSILKLQEFQGKEIQAFRERISKKKAKLKNSKDRISVLQKEIETLTEDIEAIQLQDPYLRPSDTKRRNKNRMHKVMSVRRCLDLAKKKREDIIDLETALRDLSMRTFPVLPERSTDVTEKKASK